MATIAVTPERSDSWWVFLLEGIAAILFGVLLLAAPGATLVTLTIFLGLYWLIVGVVELVRMFVDRSVSWIWSLFIGILGVAAGILVLTHPLFATAILPTSLVIYLGVLGLIIGVLGIIGSFTGGGIGSFIFGIISVIIGLALLGSPVMAALAVPFALGVLLLIEGIALVIWAFRTRPQP